MVKVVTIEGANYTPVGEPDKTVIELCEALLADAKSGKLTAIATAEVRHGTETGIGFAHGPYRQFILTAAVAELFYGFMKRKCD